MRLKKLFIVTAALLSASLLEAQNPDREKEYFKQPDYWELTLGDQKDSLERRVSEFMAANGIRERPEYVCGVADSLEKIFKNKLWFKGEIGSKISMSMAANEREAFQIAVIPLAEKDLRDVKLSISALKTPDGLMLPPESVKMYNVRYIKTIQPPYPTAHVGYWPDPLTPMQPVFIPKDETRAFWIEIRTPYNAAPGEYLGAVVVSGTEIREFTLDLRVKVWPFSLPKEQKVQTCTWVNVNNALAPEDRKDKGRRIAKYRELCLYFLDYKINTIEAGKLFYDKNDQSAVLDNLKFALDKGLMRFEIPRLKGEELKNFCNRLRAMGCFDKAMIYGFKDEPHPRDYEAFRKDSEEIRKAEPDLKIFMAETPNPGLYGAVDVWWSCIADIDGKHIQGQLKAGKEVWWYRCGIPVRLEYSLPLYYYPENGVLIDCPSLDARILYSMIWKFKMSPATFFYAGFCTVPEKFDREKMEWETGGKWLWNGDGYVIYSDGAEIYPSIRLKCMADGIEDYEYLWILREKLQSALGKNQSKDAAEKALTLLDIPPELIVETHYYNRDPHAILSFRNKIGEAIATFCSDR